MNPHRNSAQSTSLPHPSPRENRRPSTSTTSTQASTSSSTRPSTSSGTSSGHASSDSTTSLSTSQSHQSQAISVTSTLHTADHVSIDYYRDDRGIYADLNSYSFGAPSTTSRDQEPASISPYQVDYTPRPSLATSQNPSSHSAQTSPPRNPAAYLPMDNDEEAEAGDSDSDGGLYPRRRRRDDDAASQHTFGGGGYSSGAGGSRSSRIDSRSHIDGYSGDEYDSGFSQEVIEFDDTDDDENIMPDGAIIPDDYPAEFDTGRRGSLPMAIPGANPALDGRNQAHTDANANLLALRRPSRSLGNEGHLTNSSGSVGGSASQAGSGNLPHSEPLSRGDWASLEASSSLGRHDEDEESEAPNQPEASASAWLNDRGFNASFILGGHDKTGYTRRASDALSYVQTEQRRPSHSDRALFGWIPGNKRGSITTVGGMGEDTFVRHVGKMDVGHQVWMFRKEGDGTDPPPNPHSPSSAIAPWDNEFTSPRGSMSDALVGRQDSKGKNKSKDKEKHLPKGMAPGSMEIWKCSFVGRFKVERVHYRPDPSKPSHQRLNIRHILDPFNLGNKRGGPSVTIHKHSRAIAVSIYRAHNLRSANNVHRNRPGILLAPKRVQEQFTSTRTTSKLATHGLLDQPADPQPPVVSRNRPPSSTASRSTDATRTVDPKGKGGAVNAGAIGPGAPIDMAPSTSDITNFSYPSAIASSSSSATVPVAQASLESLSSTGVQSNASDAHHTPSTPNTSNDALDRALTPTRSTVATEEEDHDDYDDELLGVTKPRNRHPNDDYGTLESSIIEYVSTHPPRCLPEPSSSGNLFSRLLKRPKSHPYPTGQRSAALEGNYKAPWLAMAPRSKQEESDRVINNLNQSFKGVGLLPTTTKSSKSKFRRPKNANGPSILEKVPDDSLYMLLPLWPGETDHQHMTDNHTHNVLVSLENRLYLLVYYVPFNKDDKLAHKKRTKSSGNSMDNMYPQDERSVYLPTFKTLARLVGYDELRGSGVRLPADGLSVTGPMMDAQHTMPSPNLLAEQPATDWIIAHCHGRETGIQLLTEGMTKLGLCLPAARIPMRMDERGLVADEEVAQLSPIGRAAVEMVWSGAMALTSFGY